MVEVTAEVPGFVASGRWIEDDARPHPQLFEGWAGLVEKKGEERGARSEGREMRNVKRET